MRIDPEIGRTLTRVDSVVEELAMNFDKSQVKGAFLLAFTCLAFDVSIGLAQTSTVGVPVKRDRSDDIGSEVSVTRHLSDGDEEKLSIAGLLSHGRGIFSSNWTEQEGGGRPLTKGTGRPLSDPSLRLTGIRGFNRISAPDANSCAGCHSAPYGISGGSGDLVTNVFVLGQRFDFATSDPSDKVPTRGAADEEGKVALVEALANQRATTGLFGAGYLEMLARQITEDLQATRDNIKPGQTKELVSKGISFGRLTLSKTGTWDTSKVEGLGRLSLLATISSHPPSLVIRPWHQASNVVSIREFTNNAFNHHHGIQSTERFGVDADPDGDGFKNELTRADMTAVSIYQAAIQLPGRVIPRVRIIEEAVLRGEKLFDQVGCATCHIPRLPLDKKGWIYSEPNPYNPPGNLRTGETKTLYVDLSSDELPVPRLKPDPSGVVWVEAYTDFKLHDICEPEDAEPLDMNQSPWSKKFKEGNRRFLTKRLWGAANMPNHFHHGLFTTMRRSVLAHAGEAQESRRAFQALPAGDQDSLIEFLKTLQVLPPGTKDLIVDENFKAREWPPAWSKGGSAR
ncbi:MAG: di-heme oxidoredictase family protein [Bryobacteraceae bacterium]|nr:di-heme oxidoredictase family protein [Bryobacteraceae bacterium]